MYLGLVQLLVCKLLVLLRDLVRDLVAQTRRLLRRLVRKGVPTRLGSLAIGAAGAALLHSALHAALRLLGVGRGLLLELLPGVDGLLALLAESSGRHRLAVVARLAVGTNPLVRGRGSVDLVER